MTRAGYCTRCHRAEPVTCAEIDGAPGYWRAREAHAAYDLRELEAEPCGRDCYPAPMSEYQGTTYPYTRHDRDPPYTDEPGYCRHCRLVRPVTETDVARDFSWWQSHMRPDTFKIIYGTHCHTAPIAELVPRVSRPIRENIKQEGRWRDKGWKWIEASVSKQISL